MQGKISNMSMVDNDRRHVRKVFSDENAIYDNNIDIYNNDICDTNVTANDNNDIDLDNINIYDDSSDNFFKFIDKVVVMKMDSAASRSMSGCPDRIIRELNLDTTVNIIGFDGSMTQPSRVGVNSDGKLEYYVPDMPSDLALLCAYEYAKDGAVVLLPDGGVCLKLNTDELNEVKKMLASYCVSKELVVKNQTYEVRPDKVLNEVAMSNTAIRFFNTKVNVSNVTERILTLLMTGLSFKDLYMHVCNESLNGIPQDVTKAALNRFEHRYGRTPDIVQLAVARNPGHHKGLMAPKPVQTRCGERYEIDCMECDYNTDSTVKLGQKQKKLLTHGGAVAAAVGVDCFSGFVHGKLLKSVAKAEEFVKEFISRVEVEGWNVHLLAADSGIMSSSMFQVMTPAVEALCLHHTPVIKVARSEPYDHSVETGTVEVVIGMIKRLIRLAVTLILRNPNMNVTGFSTNNILKLWGEYFHWAIAVINMKPSPHDSTRSRFEVFKKMKPNMQNIRLLPISSIVMAWRSKSVKGSQSNQSANLVGI